MTLRQFMEWLASQDDRVLSKEVFYIDTGSCPSIEGLCILEQEETVSIQ